MHRLSFRRLAHARLLAQRLGRADPGAHAAEDVLLQDRLAGAPRLSRRDLADEERNVDRRGAGRHAGRIVAEVASVGSDLRLVRAQRRVEIREILGKRLRGQSTGG